MSAAAPSNPRGRGALIQSLLKKKSEEEANKALQGATPEPQKPKGRAALLSKLLSQKVKQVGLESATSLESPNRTNVETLAKKLETTTLPSYLEKETGKSGTVINVATNYIRLTTEKDRGVFEFEVLFNPPVDANSRRIKLVSTVLKDIALYKLFDGGSCLYLPTQITSTKQDLKTSFTLIDGTVEDYTITLIYKRKKRLGDCLHMINILFKRIMHLLLYTRSGRNYFDMVNKILIPQHRLEVCPGFVINADEYDGGVMLCLDSTHRIIRTLTVYEYMQEVLIVDRQNFKQNFTNKMLGMVVMTKYNNQTYRVDDIGWDMNPKDTFPLDNGGVISYCDYYKKQYDITIKDDRQPLLLHHRTIQKSGSTEKVDHTVCLVPEVCYITGLTDEMKTNFQVKKDIAMYTRVNPQQRLNALRTFLENVANCSRAQELLNGWGLKLAGGSTDIHARQLQKEVLIFGNGNRVQLGENADWNKALSENQLFDCVDIMNWTLFFTQRDQEIAKEFATLMVRLGTGMGCRIREPKMVRLSNDNTISYTNACREHLNHVAQIAVFIVPTIREDRYCAIKRTLCTKQPLPSQVIISKTLRNPKRVRSITQKIALQMVCKVGGGLWGMNSPLKNWMICGIDVCHGKNIKSVGTLVCSMNNSLSKWYSLPFFQEKELGDCYKMAFIRGLEKSKDCNGVYPDKVFIIRDGVSDGELDYCLNYEVEQFEQVIRDFKLPTTLCFVVVQKRINAKFFRKGEGGKVDNPLPGTIIDTVVTKPKTQDFYLISQSVREGTVNPCRYIVLKNTANIKLDNIQRLCYKLCHMYYNWAGTIKVPAPCQLAHKLAYLIGQVVKQEPSAELLDKLFYL